MTNTEMATKMAEMDTMVVAKNGSMEWTRQELDALFSLVASKENWKLPINANVVLGSDREVLGMTEAVIFFTGSVPHIDAIRANGRKVVYKVTAAGYYATIGA